LEQKARAVLFSDRDEILGFELERPFHFVDDMFGVFTEHLPEICVRPAGVNGRVIIDRDVMPEPAGF
jgi:hypothetical protein